MPQKNSLHRLYGSLNRTIYNLFHETKRMTYPEIKRVQESTKQLPNSIELVHSCPLSDNSQGARIRHLHLSDTTTLKYYGAKLYARAVSVGHLVHEAPKHASNTSTHLKNCQIQTIRMKNITQMKTESLNDTPDAQFMMQTGQLPRARPV